MSQKILISNKNKQMFYEKFFASEMPKSATADPDRPDVFEAMKGMVKTMKEKTSELQTT